LNPIPRQRGDFINANDVTPFGGEEFVNRNAEINRERMDNIPIINNDPNNPNNNNIEPWRYPDNDPNGGGNDPNGGGNGPDGGNNDPFGGNNGGNNFNYRRDPFADMID